MVQHAVVDAGLGGNHRPNALVSWFQPSSRVSSSIKCWHCLCDTIVEEVCQDCRCLRPARATLTCNMKAFMKSSHGRDFVTKLQVVDSTTARGIEQLVPCRRSLGIANADDPAC